MLEQRLQIAEVSKSCPPSDLESRVQVGVEMSEDLGVYPTGCSCPDYVDKADKTLGILTWDELLAYMGEVSRKGRAELERGGAWPRIGDKRRVLEP